MFDERVAECSQNGSAELFYAFFRFSSTLRAAASGNTFTKCNLVRAIRGFQVNLNVKPNPNRAPNAKSNAKT